MLDHKDILPHYYQERLKPCFDLQEGFQMNPEERMNDIHSYYEQQILKYIYRYPFKNGVEAVSYTHLTLPTKRIV